MMVEGEEAFAAPLDQASQHELSMLWHSMHAPNINGGIMIDHSLMVYRRIRSLPLTHVSSILLMKNEKCYWKKKSPKMDAVLAPHVISAIQYTHYQMK
jgi:hypothetical protein